MRVFNRDLTNDKAHMNTAPTPIADPPGGSDGHASHSGRQTPGFTDGLGERVLVLEPGTAMPLEVLRFKPAFSDSTAFETSLRQRVDVLAHVQHPSLGVVKRVERLEPDNRLALVSRHTAGRRLSELFPKARGPVFALELIREIAPALSVLQQQGPSIAHGLLTVDRIVATREGRLVAVDQVVGSAIEALHLPATLLRSDLGIAVAAAESVPQLDARSDVVQLAFIALSLLLGRRLEPAEYPGNISALLDEFNAMDPVASRRMRLWLERAFQFEDRPFANAREAHQSFLLFSGDATSGPVESRRPPLAFPKPVESTPPVSVERRGAALREAHESSTAGRPDQAPVLPPMRRSRSIASLFLTHWKIAGALLIAVAGGLILSIAYVPRLTTAPPIAVVGPPVATRRADFAASAATALVRATPPPVPSAPSVGDPGLEGAEPTPVAEIPAAAAPAPTPPAAPPAPQQFGGVRLTSAIELQVFEDGTLVGSSAGPIALAAGSRTLDLVNEALGFRERKTLTVKAGQMTSLAVAIPNGRLSINAVPWADVWIDGKPAGQTPLANLSIAIGSHEILFRHPDFPEHRQTAVVKVEGLTRVSMTFPR
jgi:hypothetical protein